MTSDTATIVINLAHRADRRAEMDKELARVGWSAEYFPAIRPADPAGFPSIGARGCFLSHLAVLKQAVKAGAQRLVILEDDVNFSNDFLRSWDDALNALDIQEWAIFYPGHILEDSPAGLSLLPPTTGVRCTHFMLVNGRAIPTLIDGLETILARQPGHPLGGPMHVDGAYSTVRMQNPDLEAYAHWPSLAYQRPSRTDIGGLKWFDRIERLRPLMGLLRRGKAVMKQKAAEA